MNADLADGDGDPTWQALEDLRLELRKPTLRGDRLHDALTASLGVLAEAAASLHADGGLETPADGAPDELLDEIGGSTTGRRPGAHRGASPPAAAASVPAPAPVPPSATPAAPRWEPDPALQQRDAPSGAGNDPQAGGPVEISITEPLPEHDTAAAAPGPTPTWSAGASRTNPVPPPTTPTRAPWAPADTVEQPLPTPNGVAPSSSVAPVGAQPAGPQADLAEQVQVILAAMRDKAVPIEDGMRDRALSSTQGMLDRPVPIAERRVAARSRDGHADARRTSSPSTHPWVIGLAGMVVLLISALVTYALLRG